MAFVKFYFRHHKTTLLSIAGKGETLPEMTSLILDIDETQNRAGAPEHCSSYLFEDPHGLSMSMCHWCVDLEQLGEVLGGLWWHENDRPAATEKFVVKSVYFSSFRFTNLGSLGDKPVKLAG